MKRTYIAPQSEEVTMVFTSLLCASVVSDNGIGYGGVDTEGVKEPSAPPIDVPFDFLF